MSKYKWLLIFFVVCIESHSLLGKSIESPANLASPLIDTSHPRFDYFASATIPFGMVALSPDTKHGDLWDSGYRYDDKYILDFSHIHNAQTAGIPVMPVIGPCKGNLGFEANKSHFSHDKEIVKPGYHKVFLEDSKIMVELTSTCRVGFHRYTFPQTSEAHILFDLGAELGPTKMSFAYARQVSDDEIEGYSIMEPTLRRKKPCIVYFVARFNKPFKDFGGWKTVDKRNVREMVNPENGLISGDGCGAKVTYYNLQEGDQLMLKVAVSFVSMTNARMNLESELPQWNFDSIVDDAFKAWNKYLGRIQVGGGTHDQQVKFYTDLMHTAIGKRIASDVNGEYADWTGLEPVIRKLPTDQKGNPKYPFLDADGLWGSQWNLNILWSLIYPEYGNWMAETFLEYYRNAGMMSRSSWGGNYSYVMIGDQATPLLAALMSTKRNTYDAELAYKAAYKNAFPGGIRDRAGYETGEHPAGGGIDWYIKLGYVPVEIENRGSGMHRDGSSMTLEYAYQDWCLATMAKILGKDEDAELFMKRSKNWKNVFDQVTGWARPRLETGKWLESFSPVSDGKSFNTPGFCEGNSAIYTFYVPHDMKGLIDEMGGKDQFVNKLESNFKKAQPYRFITPHGEHGSGWVDYENQPSCELAHLFSYAGFPWKTQYWVRQVKDITFGGVDPYSGYNGDEDQGQMGALGVLMAIGLFNVQGCVGEKPNIEITTPLFDKTTINIPSLENNEQMMTFTILVNRKNINDIYIQEAYLNNVKWNDFKIPVSEFFKGGILSLKLGEKPNRKWGIK